MARIPFVSRAKSAEFEIQTLLNTESPKQGFLCLSASSWELCYQLVQFYGDWRSRYYYEDELTGEKLTITDEEYFQVLQAVQLAQEELQMSGCEDLVNAVTALGEQLAGLAGAALQANCGCIVGEGVDNGEGEIEGSVPDSVGSIDMSTATMAADRTCKAANWILGNLLALFTYLDNSGIDQLTNSTLPLMMTIIGAAFGSAMSPGFGTLLGAIAGLVLGFAVIANAGGLDFSLIADAFNDYREEIICCMYSGLDVASIRACILDILENDAGLTGANLDIASLCLPNLVLNHLFFTSNSGAESEIQAYTPIFDCDAECDAIIWDWESDSESWAHTDQSDVCASGSGAWSASGVLTNHLQTDGSANCNAQSAWKLAGLSIGVSSASLVVAHTAPTDSDNTGLKARIYYNSDASYVEQTEIVTAKGLIQVDLASAQTISSVEIIAARTNGAGGGPSYDLTISWRYAKLIWS